jgi:hypothetical protein
MCNLAPAKTGFFCRTQPRVTSAVVGPTVRTRARYIVRNARPDTPNILPSRPARGSVVPRKASSGLGEKHMCWPDKGANPRMSPA